MKVDVLAAVMAVRTRLMKAVFFFREESKESLTGKVSYRADLNRMFPFCLILRGEKYLHHLPKPSR